MHSRLRLAPLLSIFLLLSGCRTELTTDLDETEANRVTTKLIEGGVPARTSKSGDGAQVRYAVTVPTAEAARSQIILDTLEQQGGSSEGDTASRSKGAFLPSFAEEAALPNELIQNQLINTLESVAQVTDARVHLASNPSRGLLGINTISEDSPPPSASVLLRHSSPEPPLSVLQIKALVAGAVTGLAPEEVTVVTLREDVAAQPRPPRLLTIGPFVVTAETAPTLKLWLGISTLITAVMALLAVTAALRSRHLQRQLQKDDGLV